jgi:hypothetical protein
MARPTPELIHALRTTAKRLKSDIEYYWSHQGSCNCGHLAQTITGISKVEIHRVATERYGDWEDHAEDYCATSGHHLDQIITAMLEIGMTRDDIGRLERLSDNAVLMSLPAERRTLQYNRRDDVILYMEAWAALLEEQILRDIQLPEELFKTPTSPASDYHGLRLNTTGKETAGLEASISS